MLQLILASSGFQKTDSLGLEADTADHYLIPLVFSHDRPST